MVPLTTAAGPFEARVMAAHLGAEGIVWELRGGADGPYPLGPVEVLVAEGDLAVAREVVAEHIADGEPGSSRTVSERSPRALWVVLALVLLSSALLLGRLLAVAWH